VPRATKIIAVPLEGGRLRERPVEERAVDVDPHDRVAAAGQLDGHPSGAASGVEDRTWGVDQGGDEGCFAVDVGSAGRELFPPLVVVRRGRGDPTDAAFTRVHVPKSTTSGVVGHRRRRIG
jgi:hypothetical protein